MPVTDAPALRCAAPLPRENGHDARGTLCNCSLDNLRCHGCTTPALDTEEILRQTSVTPPNTSPVMVHRSTSVSFLLKDLLLHMLGISRSLQQYVLSFTPKTVLHIQKSTTCVISSCILGTRKPSYLISCLRPCLESSASSGTCPIQTERSQRANDK